MRNEKIKKERSSVWFENDEKKHHKKMHGCNRKEKNSAIKRNGHSEENHSHSSYDKNKKSDKSAKNKD